MPPAMRSAAVMMVVTMVAAAAAPFEDAPRRRQHRRRPHPCPAVASWTLVTPARCAVAMLAQKPSSRCRVVVFLLLLVLVGGTWRSTDECDNVLLGEKRPPARIAKRE